MFCSSFVVSVGRFSFQTPGTKEYAGFTAPQTQTVRILGDGSLEVNYYYTRNTNTPYKVEHWQENLPTENNETGNNNNPDDLFLLNCLFRLMYNFLVLLGQTQGLPLHRTWDKWTVGGSADSEQQEIADIQHRFTIGLENVEYTAMGAPNTDTPYVVKHWKENLPTETTNDEQNKNQDDVGAGPLLLCFLLLVFLLFPFLCLALLHNFLLCNNSLLLEFLLLLLVLISLLRLVF